MVGKFDVYTISHFVKDFSEVKFTIRQLDLTMGKEKLRDLRQTSLCFIIVFSEVIFFFHARKEYFES